MNAVILAAGIGSRLRPITDSRPKCLVEVAGQSILKWQLDGYAAAGVDNVVVVAGYMAEQVESFCRAVQFPGRLSVVVNTEYSVTNNLYSLRTALECVDGSSFVSNADVVFDASIVKGLAQDPYEDLIAVQPGFYLEESMKVTVDQGRVTGISKLKTPAESFGVSIDLYKFSSGTLAAIKQTADSFFSTGERSMWTEVAIDGVTSTCHIHPWDIGQGRWIEIDNLEDLAEGQKIFVI